MFVALASCKLIFLDLFGYEILSCKATILQSLNIDLSISIDARQLLEMNQLCIID